VAWPTGNSIVYVIEVTLHWAWLVLRWVTICEYAVLICKQPLRPTQPPTLGRSGSEFRPKSSEVLSSWEGNRRSGVSLVMRHRLCGFSGSTSEMSTQLTLLQEA